MTTKPITNVSASVRAKLLELSRKNGEQFNFLLTCYALERLLYRLGSTNRERFVLKGAMLFALWTTTARHRPTVDKRACIGSYEPRDWQGTYPAT